MEGAMKNNATFPAPDATPDCGQQQADPHANIDIFATRKGKPWNKGKPTHWGQAVQDTGEWFGCQEPAPTYATRKVEQNSWEEQSYQHPPGYDPC